MSLHSTRSARPVKEAQSVPVPKSFDPDGHPYRDQLIRLAGYALAVTASDERYQAGDWIYFGRAQYRAWFGGDNGHKILPAAEQCGLIERNNSYLAGRKPKSIRLEARHRTGDFRAAELDRRARAKLRPSIETVGEVGVWLFDQFRHFELDDSAKPVSKWDKLLIERLRRGMHFATRDDFGRRFHSSWSGLPKYLRQHLRQSNVSHNEERECAANPASFFSSDSLNCALIELDVKTCQPLLIGAAAFNEQMRPSADIYEWLELCQKHDLYQAIADDLGTDRETAKQRINVPMFGTVADANKSRVGKLIARRWPSVWSFLARLKADDHRAAAMLGQRTESSLMIDGACGALMRSHPEVPILTVHDAIICPAHHCQAVRAAVLAAFRPLGVVPRIEEKPINEVRK